MVIHRVFIIVINAVKKIFILIFKLLTVSKQICS